MRYESVKIVVPEQPAGPAELKLYLLDAISTAPERKRPIVIVIPGGGYRNLSDRTKEPIAIQFLSMGYHAAVFEYSLAPTRFPVALHELAEAIATIREHAEEWRIENQKIILCGSSAGGHLAGCIGAFWNRAFTFGPIGRTADEVRANGLILCYPVITSGEYRHANSFKNLLGEEVDTELRLQEIRGEINENDSLLNLVSLEKQVTEGMPPVFLWHTITDDAVPVENSFLLAAALKEHHVKFEMHIYPSGCHGLSLATEETAGNQTRYLEPCCQSWISLVKTWLEQFKND